MIYSKLSDHKFKKGKFTTPFNDSMSNKWYFSSWYHERLPEYLWIALILNYYGRKNGLEICNMIVKKILELSKDIIFPRFSQILSLDRKSQTELYEYILTIVDGKVLSPLTVIFTYSISPVFSVKFCGYNLSCEDRINEINNVMEKSSDQQSNFTTDIKYIIVNYNILAGKCIMREELLKEITEYPNLNHDNIKTSIIRSLIRALEISEVQMLPNNKEYLNYFWNKVSNMSECKLFFVKYEEKSTNSKDYMDKIQTKLQYYSNLFMTCKPLDNKMLVILGIAVYSYKRLNELVAYNLYNTIAARSIIRVLIEDYIMMKYLIKNEYLHKDIWSEYQYYGIGLYKLVVERYRELGKDIKNSHVEYDYLNVLVSEFKNKEFIDMDTSYFNKQNIREKALNVGEQELYGLYYDYDSSFEHGLWGAIRESSLLKCNSPAHQYHCVPDIECNQKLQSVWHDCVNVMDKTLLLLQELYGLPEKLAPEVNENVK